MFSAWVSHFCNRSENVYRTKLEDHCFTRPFIKEAWGPSQDLPNQRPHTHTAVAH
jgi:hypothetical protein